MPVFGIGGADLLRRGKFTPFSLLQASLNVRNLPSLLADIRFQRFDWEEAFAASGGLHQLLKLTM